MNDKLEQSLKTTCGSKRRKEIAQGICERALASFGAKTKRAFGDRETSDRHTRVWKEKQETEN